MTESIFTRSVRIHRFILIALALACAASVLAADREAVRGEQFLDLHGLWLAPVILPRNAQDSLLVKRIEGRVLPRKPFGQPLSADQIQTIRKWIDAGALKDGFEQAVKPIFAARCNGCHGATAAGRLRMDTYEFLKERIGPGL